MARCIQCDAPLPGDETLCRKCYQSRYAEVADPHFRKPPRKTIDRALLEFANAVPVTTALLMINAAVCLAMALSPPEFRFAFTAPQFLAWGANYGPLIRQGEYWRLLTSNFLHAGLWHLVLNMACLASLGGMVEAGFGWRRVLALYVVSGVGCGAASVIVHPQIISVGASGSIFGMAGFLLMAMLSGKISIIGRNFGNPLRSLTLFCLYNLAIGLLLPDIDASGHIGGLLPGLLMGAFFTGRESRVTVDIDSMTIVEEEKAMPAEVRASG